MGILNINPYLFKQNKENLIEESNDIKYYGIFGSGIYNKYIHELSTPEGVDEDEEEPSYDMGDEDDPNDGGGNQTEQPVEPEDEPDYDMGDEDVPEVSTNEPASQSEPAQDTSQPNPTPAEPANSTGTEQPADTEGNSSDNSADDNINNEPDYDMGDEDTSDNGDVESDVSEDEPNFDLPDDEGENGDGGTEPDAGDNGNLPGGDTNVSDPANDPRAKLRELENSIFDQLSPADKKIKIMELKSLYNNAYTKCDGILALLEDIPKDTKSIKVIDYIENSLNDLKSYIIDYLNDAFDNRTYIENLKMFNEYLYIFDSINNVFVELKKGAKDI